MVSDTDMNPSEKTYAAFTTLVKWSAICVAVIVIFVIVLIS